MRAEEWFGQVRDAVLALGEAEDHAREMRSTLTLKAQTYETGRPTGYAQSDGVESLLDMERSVEQRGFEVQAMQGEAERVLYGDMHRCGVAKLKGLKYADAIHLRCVEALGWPEVAERMGCTARWCRTLCKAGYAYIDRVGWAAIESANEVEEEYVKEMEE